MPKRGAKSASAKIRERIEFLDDEEWVDTENDFFLKLFPPLFGTVAGESATEDSLLYITHFQPFLWPVL